MRRGGRGELRNQKGKWTGAAQMAGLYREELDREGPQPLVPIRDLTGRIRNSRSSLTTWVLRLFCTLNEPALSYIHVCVYTSIELQSL